MSTDTLTHRALRLLEFFGPLTSPQIGAVLDRSGAFTTAMLHTLTTLKSSAAVARVGMSDHRSAYGRRQANRWAITDAGRAALLQGHRTPIRAGGLPHLTLSRASAEPQSVSELCASVCHRYDLDLDPGRLGQVAYQLQACGLLERGSRTREREPWAEGALGPNRIYTYVLTPAGEDMLTRLPRPA